MESPLKDKWIVITRPKHQADSLRIKLEAAGANVVLFPLLEITTPDNICLTKQMLSKIKKYDLGIFTSANAVEYTLKWSNKDQLSYLKIAAIGKKTALLLESHGIHVDFFPKQGFNSEALLAMPEIKLLNSNTNIVIFRGQNGREFLKNGLETQGKKVDYIDVYKRIFPHSDINFLEQCFKKNQLDTILITSGTSLKNLFKFLPENRWLEKTSLLIGSKRIQSQVLNYPNYQGKLLSTTDPSDETLYQRLLQWGIETT